MSNFAAVESTLRDSTASMAERGHLVEMLLSHCANAFSNAVGECSDLAEGAGIHDLQGDEGSLLRAQDCCRKLRAQHAAAVDEASEALEAAQRYEQLLSEASSGSSNGDIADQLEDSSSTHAKEIDRLQEQVNGLQSALEAAETARTDLGEEVNALHEQLQGAATLEVELRARESELEKEVSATEQRWSDKHSAELSVSQASVVRLEQLVFSLEAEKKTANEEAASLAKDIEGVRAELQASAAQVVEMQQQVIIHSDSSAQSVELETLRAKMARLETELGQQTDQMRASEERIAVAHVGAEVARNKVVEIEEKLAAVQLELETARSDASRSIEEVRSELEAQRLLVAQREQELQQIKAEHAIVAQQLQEAKRSSAEAAHAAEKDLAAKLAAARKTAQQQLTTANAAAQRELQVLQTQIDASQLTSATYLTRVGLLLGALQDSEQAGQEAQLQMTELQSQIEAQTAQLCDQQAQFDTERADMQAALEEETLRASSGAELLEEVRRREGEAAGVLSTLEDVKTDIQQLRGENERLSDKLLAESKLVKDKEREVRSAQSALQLEQQQVEVLRSQQQQLQIGEKPISSADITNFKQNR